MDPNPQQRKRQENTLSLLKVAIEAVNLAKEVSGPTPAKAVFGSVSILLSMIRDSMLNKIEYVELGLACADVCKALHRGMGGKKMGDLSQSVREATNQLTTTVEEIRNKVAERSRQHIVSRLVHSKNDKDLIVAWKSDLGRILQVFNTELIMNIHVTVSDIRRDVSKIQGKVNGQVRSVSSSDRRRTQHPAPVHRMPGESPPPPPRTIFGRDEEIREIVSLAEDLSPIALIGPGGIGKTSIALTVLHHDRIKKRFGDNRRFIRCDQFPASRTHLLNRLSQVIGADIETLEDLTPLQPFLSSGEMILFLDNAETIFNPRGPNAQEIYAVVEELSQFNNLCLCITSRISTVPLDCKRLDIPKLSMAAAHNTFYRIYDSNEPSKVVSDILEQLDFHPLSITLLATVAHRNKWDANQLSKKLGSQRMNILRAHHNTSLAKTIKISLASPMFQELGPNARELLGVTAFFPQGIDEKNLEWLFPAISNRTKAFNSFCALSLTYRSDGFIMMLAPLRDHLRPKASSPLLRATRDHYFSRLSVPVDPDKPGFEKTRWIVSEDVNIEHLLDVFTSADVDSFKVWDTCACFMEHLYWHKKRLVVLGPRIEGLPDNHHSKPQCLLRLSRLYNSVGNCVEQKRLLAHALKLWRERGDDYQVAGTLRIISNANRLLGYNAEGIEQAREALDICQRLDDTLGQAQSRQILAQLLYHNKQLNAAEEAVLWAIDIFGENNQFEICQCHILLGDICRSRGEVAKALKHFEIALEIASSNWHEQLFWIYHSLAELFLGEKRFDDARAHIEHARSHAINSPRNMARTMHLEARVWYKNGRFEEARSQAMRALDAYEKLGATQYAEHCRRILQIIERAISKRGVRSQRG